MLTVLAGDTVEVSYSEGIFTPCAASEDSFRIRTLNYFECQKVLATSSDEEKVRVCIELGLVAIGGDEAKAKEFVKSPRARFVNPLFAAIWELAWGN